MSTVKKVRDRLGLSQMELGKKLGVSDDVISRLERGITKPRQEILLGLKKLQEALFKKRKTSDKLSEF